MFKKLTKDAILPMAQTQLSAGYDVYANEDVIIAVGETKIIPLGVALDFQSFYTVGKNREVEISNYYLGLYLRSSLGAKGLSLPNGVGIIDIDYKDEIKMIIHNHVSSGIGFRVFAKHGNEENENSINFHGKEFVIKKGDRVGQLIFQKHSGFELLQNEYRTTKERKGGFGSTGKAEV